MKRALIAALVLWTPCIAKNAQASLSEVGSVSATGGEAGFQTSIDIGSNQLVFGSTNPLTSGTSSGTPVAVFVTTPTFAYSTSQSTGNLIYDWGAAVYDPSTGYGFFASSTSPAALVAFPLTSPSVSFASTTFTTGVDSIRTGVIDTTAHIAYFGTDTSPGIIVKVTLPVDSTVSSMTVVSTITLPTGIDHLSASAIDITNEYAYFASSTTPGAIVKIDLSNFSLVGSVSLNPGEGAIGSAVYDATIGSLFVGTHDSPGQVVEITASPFARRRALTLTTGENDLAAAVIDDTDNRAYFATNTSPGRVVSISLLGFVEESSKVTFASGEDYPRTGLMDATNGYAYFGTFTNPGIVVKVDVLAGSPEISIQPADTSVTVGQSASFSITVRGRGLTYQWQRDGVDLSGATSATYTLSSTVIGDDGAIFKCVVTGTNGSVTSSTARLTVIPVVRAYPNPWRSDRHSSVGMTFDGLASNSTIKIFNLAMHWVRTLPNASGSTTWDLKNDRGELVASGYYFYLVTTGRDEQTVHGKIAIIR